MQPIPLPIIPPPEIRFGRGMIGRGIMEPAPKKITNQMMKKICLPAFLSLALAACAADTAPKTFDVRELGAKGDGATYDTEVSQ